MRLTNASADLYVRAGRPADAGGALADHALVCRGPPGRPGADGLYGIAACFGRGDRWFTGVTVTDGGGSVRAGKYADHTDDEIIEVRRLEQRKAALVGEYACQVQLMYPSSDIKKPDNEGVIADLRAVLETARPQVVYLHNPADRHDTHVAAFCRALSALRLR